MSNPKNPLDYFRSYNYHHILMVCDGTDTAKLISDSPHLTDFIDDNDTKFCPKKVKEGNGNYIVLINGMTDTSFTITSAKWSSVLIPNDTNTGETDTHYRTMAVDGELEIKEPKGVNFLNILNDCSIKLGVDATGLVFILKTIFIGHTEQGKTEYITTIRPVEFMMYDVISLFDITGAEYVISFVGMANGASRLPRTSSVSEGFSFSIEQIASEDGTLVNPTMEQACLLLTNKLNQHYAEQKQKLVAQAQKATPDGETFDFNKEFMDVTYEIRRMMGMKRCQLERM